MTREERPLAVEGRALGFGVLALRPPRLRGERFVAGAPPPLRACFH